MNWESHFRAVSSREKAKKRASFGALGLTKTAADLRDLVAAKDQVMNGLRAQMHPPIAPDILSDFAALDQRYQAARKFAMPMLDYAGQSITPGFVEGLTSAKNEYDAILKALSQGYPSQHTIQGDLQDITRRLGAAYKPGPPAPQPGQHPADVFFKAADAMAQAMPDTIKGAVDIFAPSLVPKNKEEALYHKEGQKIKDMMSPLLMVAVGVGAVALVVSLKR